MPTPRALAERIAATPFASDTGHRILEIDTSDDSIDLAPGAYDAYLDGSTLAYGRIGASVDLPSDKAAEKAGQFPIPPGGVVTFVVSGATTVALHAKTASGTGTLHIMRKPL